MKIQKKKKIWGGGGRVGGVRVDVNEKLKFLRKFKKKNLGGGRVGGDQGGCERRIEVFVKIENRKKKKLFGGGGSGQGGGRVGGVRVDVNREVKFL